MSDLLTEHRRIIELCKLHFVGLGPKPKYHPTIPVFDSVVCCLRITMIQHFIIKCWILESKLTKTTTFHFHQQNLNFPLQLHFTSSLPLISVPQNPKTAKHTATAQKTWTTLEFEVTLDLMCLICVCVCVCVLLLRLPKWTKGKVQKKGSYFSLFFFFSISCILGIV